MNFESDISRSRIPTFAQKNDMVMPHKTVSICYKTVKMYDTNKIPEVYPKSNSFIIERDIQSYNDYGKLVIVAGITQGGNDGIRVSYEDEVKMHRVRSARWNDSDSITYACTGGVKISFNRCKKGICYDLMSPKIPNQSGHMKYTYKPILLGELDHIERLKFSKECRNNLYEKEKNIKLYELGYLRNTTTDRLPQLKKEFKIEYDKCLQTIYN